MGLDQNCTSNSTNKGASMINYVTDPNTYQTPSGNETLLKQWVAEVGTISVCVYVSSKFQLYKSGKYIRWICLLEKTCFAITCSA